MSPACHVSAEIHKLLEHEKGRPEGRPRYQAAAIRLEAFLVPRCLNRALVNFEEARPDYYEAQRQPHDGAHGDKVFATSYESAIRKAGFDVLVISNPGRRRGLGAHQNGAA